MKVRRIAAVGLACGIAVTLLTGCEENTTLNRPSAPVVLTGAQIAGFKGVAPGKVVAFRHSISGSTGTWTQIPVQVDQRKVVPFGAQPGSNTTAGRGRHRLRQRHRRRHRPPVRRPQHVRRAPTPIPTSTPTTSSCSWRPTPAAIPRRRRRSPPAGVVAGTGVAVQARRSPQQRRARAGSTCSGHRARSTRPPARTTSTTTSP